MVPGRALLADVLAFATTAGATATDPLLVGAKVGLFTGSPNLTVDTVIGDLTEPTFGGYAQKNLGTLSTQYVDDEGTEQRDSALLTWAPSDASASSLVTGWFLTDAGGTEFLGGEFLDTPKLMADTSDHLPIVVSPTLPAATVLGQGTVVS